jgi:PAS domain S-box-containing protein
MEELDRRKNNDAFQNSPHLLAVVAFDSTLKVVNEAWIRGLGYRQEELVGYHLYRLVDDQDRAMVLRLINPRLIGRDPGPFELSLRCKDRSYRAFEWERRRVAAEDTVFIVGKDITEKKKIETTGSLQLYELEAHERKMKWPPAG